MESFLRIALSNAALATAAAVLAWIAGRLVRKPALTHMLWLIVLLKLITPPLWTVPFHFQSRPTVGSASPPLAVSPVSAEPICARDDRYSEELIASNGDVVPNDLTDVDVVADVLIPDKRSEAAEVIPAPAAVDQAKPRPQTPVAATAINWRRWIRPSVLAIWGLGALICLAVSGKRIVAFARVLRFAVPVSQAYQRRADLLSRRLGMDASPQVALVPGAVCPMLWSAGGRPRVLVPGGLWDNLDERQRDTLLLHELAHLRRRDHWVRWFELLVTALYWWHPVCWWARYELREAEEQCCDAWVLWMMPGSFTDYASALLEAVDFVSIRSSVPVLASGMGQFGHLKRRLTMLKQGNVARALTWTGFTGACGVGALLLSISPTVAQTAEREADNPQSETPKAVVVTEVRNDAVVKSDSVVVTSNKPVTVSKGDVSYSVRSVVRTDPHDVQVSAVPHVEIAIASSSSPSPTPSPTPSAAPAGSADEEPAPPAPPTGLPPAPPTPKAVPSPAAARDTKFREEMQTQAQAQVQAQRDDRAAQSAQLRAQISKLRSEAKTLRADGDDQSNEKADRVDAARERMEESLQRALSESQRLQAEKQRAQADAKRVEANKAKAKSDLDRARRDVEELGKRLQQASERLSQLEVQNAFAEGSINSNFRFQNLPDGKVTITKDGNVVLEKPQPLAIPTPTPQPQVFNFTTGKSDGPSPKVVTITPRRSTDDQERRLQNVEKQMTELLSEMKQLRKDKEKSADRD